MLFEVQLCDDKYDSSYDSKRSIGGASFIIGNFVGVYLEQEVQCVKSKFLGQIAEELREESGFFMLFFLERKVGVKVFVERENFYDHAEFSKQR